MKVKGFVFCLFALMFIAFLSCGKSPKKDVQSVDSSNNKRGNQDSENKINDSTNKDPKNDSTNKDSKNDSTNKVSKNDFINRKDHSLLENQLLIELGFCEEGSNKFDSILCSSRFFRFEPIHENSNNKSLEKGFILTISGELFSDKTFSTKINRHLVYEKENNSWVIVNEFKGSLKDVIRDKSGFAQKLILEFKVDSETYIYCQFNWNGAKYLFENCLGISKDRGKTQIKYTLNQMNEFRQDFITLIKERGFAQ